MLAGSAGLQISRLTRHWRKNVGKELPLDPNVSHASLRIVIEGEDIPAADTSSRPMAQKDET